jgi:hypothetical protein
MIFVKNILPPHRLTLVVIQVIIIMAEAARRFIITGMAEAAFRFTIFVIPGNNAIPGLHIFVILPHTVVTPDLRISAIPDHIKGYLAITILPVIYLRTYKAFGRA